MDIQLRTRGRQVSPPPWLIRHADVPLEEQIRAEVTRDPRASPDEIVERLSKRNISVSGIYVAALLARWRRPESAI